MIIGSDDTCSVVKWHAAHYSSNYLLLLTELFQTIFSLIKSAFFFYSTSREKVMRSNAMPVSRIELLATWMQSTMTSVKSTTNSFLEYFLQSVFLRFTINNRNFPSFLFNNLFLSLFCDLLSVKSAHLIVIALVYIAFRDFCKIMDNYCTINSYCHVVHKWKKISKNAFRVYWKWWG